MTKPVNQSKTPTQVLDIPIVPQERVELIQALVQSLADLPEPERSRCFAQILPNFGMAFPGPNGSVNLEFQVCGTEVCNLLLLSSENAQLIRDRLSAALGLHLQ